ncbi:FKBP-type peptidyl-prolyl cis-trans isomerase [Halodesulfurarchaeum sp.]|uniref:FKBP-type peptidyl-prolyl cis-trans isomerase n=1 Tax=Halodesulfurarchaeum sp. TaxID=1980530 RepID=UPI002FC3CD12
MAIQAGDSVTIEYTGRYEDGTVFDTSRKAVAEDAGLLEDDPDRTFEPLSADVGTGDFIEGLEDALLGMEEGESGTVTIPPETGYGEWTEDQVRVFETDELSEQFGDDLLEEGAYVKTADGTVAEILRVEDGTVRVDFNHRLAGETLTFDIEVKSVS